MILTVARVLLTNQIKAYRVHKFLIISDLLIYFGVLPILLYPDVVVLIYRDLTSFVSVETLKIYFSSIASAFIFLSSAIREGKLVVSKEQYPILMHPIEIRDFILGRIISETTFFLKFSPPILAYFYALTHISGNVFSAILAFTIFVLGIIYLESLTKILSVFRLRIVLLILSALSAFDALTGNITASYLIYIVVDAIHSCYKSPNLVQFILVFTLSLSTLYIVSNRRVDIELLHYTPKGRDESSELKGILDKTFVELKRMKIIYAPILAPISFIFGKTLSGVAQINVSLMFVAIFSLIGFVEFCAMQEASALWLYRVNSAMGMFAKSIVLKSFLSSLLVFTPILAFFLPLGIDAYTILSIIFLLFFVSIVTSLVSIKIASNVRTSVKFVGMHESEMVGQNTAILYSIVIVVLIAPLAILLVISKLFALLILAIIPVSVKIVEKYAETVDVKQ